MSEKVKKESVKPAKKNQPSWTVIVVGVLIAVGVLTAMVHGIKRLF